MTEEIDVAELREAAEQGDAEAQYRLAWCYENGKGVRWNSRTGLEWYAKAAKQGHEEAKKVLKKGWGNAGSEVGEVIAKLKEEEIQDFIKGLENFLKSVCSSVEPLGKIGGWDSAWLFSTEDEIDEDDENDFEEEDHDDEDEEDDDATEGDVIDSVEGFVGYMREDGYDTPPTVSVAIKLTGTGEMNKEDLLPLFAYNAEFWQASLVPINILQAGWSIFIQQKMKASDFEFDPEEFHSIIGHLFNQTRLLPSTDE